LRVPGGAALLFLAALAPPLLAQTTFENDPFASRFKERPHFELKFRTPEAGGKFDVVIPAGEPGGTPGRQTFVGESTWEAEAPPGKVLTVTYQDIRLEARKVWADLAAKTLTAEGDVVLEQGGSRLRGDRLDLDVTQKVGVVSNGTIDLEGGVHLKGARIAKVGARSYTLTDGIVTSCDGDRPAWYFRVRKARFTLEEYVHLTDTTFWLGGVPLLYSPYILWPAMRDRASGFLVPGLGYNTTRGFYLGLTYFWAISRSADATFTADLWTKGWYGAGGEFRAQPSLGTRIAALGYTVWDPTSAAWKWKSFGSIVSDDLGKNLRGVVNWVWFSDLNFWQSFERDFSLASTRSVQSQGFVTWSPDPVAVNVRMSHERALFGNTYVTLERRPAVEAFLRPTPILGQTLFVEGQGQVDLLNAVRGTNQPSGTYGRFDLFPKVSAPLPLMPWLSLQATLGARLTSYTKSVNDSQTALLDEPYNRFFGSAAVDLTGPSFSRVYDVAWGNVTKIKHVIEPRVDYEYESNLTDYSRTPIFDEVDVFAGTSSITYALVQRLLAKQKQGSTREIASLEFNRTHLFRLPGEGTPAGPSPYAESDGPLNAILRVNASSALNLDARAAWDLQHGQMTSASLTAILSGKESNLALSLFSSNPVIVPPPPAGSPPTSSTQIRVYGGTPILRKRLRIDVQTNYDISLGRMLESRTLVTWEHPCFKILAEYRNIRVGSVPSQDYRIALTLRNVGSFLDFTGSLW